MSTPSDIAKELTLAAIEKMDFDKATSKDYVEHNDRIATEVSKLFKSIYKAVDDARNGKL
ncbi:hypothetical protein H1D32_13135 [Anaerobacillus sp. CMMVII]|uniref:hypothetical protein n=1 Tax=Anaerobacillus sp. CMMVII TaxID=2755588 RepID=UPI0021B83960|nr:hypothetical protein [Anaerobacillus sp. CMMVII]MCT8138600.1 hypothetical protein [Anaerobacillus sp. CMMVII]